MCIYWEGSEKKSLIWQNTFSEPLHYFPCDILNLVWISVLYSLPYLHRDINEMFLNQESLIVKTLVTFAEDSVFWSQDCISDFTLSHFVNILAYKERLQLALPKLFDIRFTEWLFYLSQQQHLYYMGNARRPRATVPLTPNLVTVMFTCKGWYRRLTLSSQGKDIMQ